MLSGAFNSAVDKEGFQFTGRDFDNFTNADASGLSARNTALAFTVRDNDDIDPATGKKRERGIDAATQATLSHMQAGWDAEMQGLIDEIQAVSEQLDATNKAVRLAREGKLDRNDTSHLAILAQAGLDPNDSDADIIRQGQEQIPALNNRLGILLEQREQGIASARENGISPRLAQTAENGEVISRAEQVREEAEELSAYREEVVPTQASEQTIGFLNGV